MTEQFLIRLRKIADTDHEIFPLLKQRYSPHVFKKERITESHLKKMFEAVRWSASAENLQPWRFIYATLGTEAYSKIVDCLYDHQKKWASSTPLLILNAYKEKTKEGRENYHAMFDLGLGVGSMTVQAQYMGIALHLITEIDGKKARELFKIPRDYQIASVIAAGYYGGDIAHLSKSLQKKETQTRHRMSQEDFAFREHWKD